MRKLSVFISAVLGGACIAIAGTIFLASGAENKIIGALLFTMGLFFIVTNGLNLYTGKVPYIFDNPPKYIFDVCVIWLGNLFGTVLVGVLELYTRSVDLITIDSFKQALPFASYAQTLVTKKLDDNPLSIFILAVFCGILMYLAVDGFKNNEHPAGKYIGLFLGVSGFIVCGFEHCVANMYYFTVAEMWSGKAAVYLLIMTLGNAVGGVIFPLCRRIIKNNR